MLHEAAALGERRGMRVLSTSGVPSEANLPYSGLHQLLRPLVDELDRLPPIQRAAIMAAWGLDQAGSSDLMLTALATLNTLSDAASSAPVLVIVEDAHWLDRSTAEALAFVARRIEADPIVVLAATRDNGHSDAPTIGLEEVHLSALDDVAARALLTQRAPDLPEPVRDRMLEEAEGNPLALCELPIAWASEGTGGAEPPPTLPLTTRLERAFVARIQDLPAVTRTLLLVAAVNDGDRLSETLEAAAAINDKATGSVGPLEVAVARDLIAVEGDAIKFRHALVRVAIRQAASLSQRHAAHLALASVLSAEPHRQVWHRAAASIGRDEDVASALEATATDARRRGATANAMTAFERAAQLSTDPAAMGRRFLAAAGLALELGQPEPAARLIAEAEPLKLDPLDRTRLAWLREELREGAWSGSTPVESFVEIADSFAAEGRADLAMTCLLTVAFPLWWINPDRESRRLVTQAAERLGVPGDDPAQLAVLAYTDPVGRGAQIIEGLRCIAPSAATDPEQNYVLGSAAAAVWDYALALGFLTRAVEGLRDQGRLRLLTQALVTQSWTAMHLARETLAESAADEGLRFARETDQPRWAMAASLAKATLAAERGRMDTLAEMADAAETRLTGSGRNPMLALVNFARGRGAVAHQSYQEGLDYLTRAFDPSDLGYQPLVGAWGLSDLVEAATHLGMPDRAQDFLSRLEALVETAPGSMLLGQLAYARAMVADDETAEALYRAASEEALLNWPCYRGRMLLSYGRWLRRHRRVADSRVPLRAARETFDALSFHALADSARQELRASGETSRSRAPDARDELTPQEMQIARMAAGGMTNKAIGHKLFLSHRTVSSHLYRIFPKLNVTSRAELRDALPRDYATATGSDQSLDRTAVA